MPAPANLDKTIRQAALSLPEATEGAVCNRASFEAGKKRFLFLEAGDDSCLVMLKLKDSLPEANKLAVARPQCYRVGGTGWVTAIFSAGQLPPRGLLERWILESYRLLVPKKLVASMKPAVKKANSGPKRKTGLRKK